MQYRCASQPIGTWYDSTYLGKILIHPMYAYYIVQARGSSIVFVSTFLTFMAIGGFPAFVEDIKV